MSQNSISNKISSFIGIILLLLIIGFTVFINFFIEKPKEKAEEMEDVFIEEELALEDTLLNFEERRFMEYELADFWKLVNIHIDSITMNKTEGRTYMKIYRELRFVELNPFRDSILIKIIREAKMRDLYKNYSPSKYRVYNGIISF